MRMLLTASATAAIAVVLSLSYSSAQEQKKAVGTIERFDPRFDKLVPKDSQVEEIGSGFEWCEGPVWMRAGFLLFSDIPNNRIMKWKKGEGVSEFLKPSGYTGKEPRGGEPGSNGLNVDGQGRLVLCEHGDRRITRIEKNGQKTLLASYYKGKRFNSPNDLTVHSNGDVYFTDPPYGLVKNWDDPARELDFCGVFCISAKDGSVTLLTKELTRPNGIVFSPDEKTLYVAVSDPMNPVIMSYPVKEDGTIDAGKVFIDFSKTQLKGPGGPDGMKVDKQGNLFAAAPGGIAVIAPDATILGRLNTDDRTANCAFGEDGQTLFLAINHRVGRIRLSTTGKGF